MLALAMQFSRFPALALTGRLAGHAGRFGVRRASGEVHALSDVPSKLNSVRGRVVPGAAVPLPVRGGTRRTGERSDRVASDRLRERPGL